MKHIIMCVTLIVSMVYASGAYAAAYGWSGFGGESNEWSNADNWTNVIDSSTGVPGAGDDALFPKADVAPPSTTVALDSDVSINNIVLGNSFGGMNITGAYTLTITASAPVLWGANYYGGHAMLDCKLVFPNVGADIVWVNFNQEFTLNGDVELPIGNTTRQLIVNGENAKTVFNGQLRGYDSGTSQRLNFFCNPDAGMVELGTQHDPLRAVMCRKGTLILKGNWDAPNGDTAHSVGFPNWDGNTPRRIWVVAEETGTAVFSNRFSFLPRGDTTRYQEFAVKAPTINAICVGQVRIDDKIWWFVEPGSYLKLAGGINKGDSAAQHGVYVDGGGTTDIARAALTTFEIPFIISNGVVLANNGATGLATHGPVTVCEQGVLGGEGGVGALFTESGARITPGNSVGTLSVSNNCALAAGTIIDWDVQDATADLLQVYGTLDLSAGIVTVRVHGATAEYETNAVMAYATLLGSKDNVVLDLSMSELEDGVVLDDGAQILVTGLVPEPGLLGAAALALLGWKRR